MFLCRPCRLLALCCALLPLCLPLGGSTAPAEEYDGRRAADVRSLAAAAQISPAAKQARPTATPTPPAGEQTARAQGLPAALFADNPRLPTQILAFCAVFLYFFLLWRRLGADPPKGIIAPRTQPPPAPVTDKATAVAPLSPLAADYLRNAARVSGRGLAAAFLDLAFRGLCVVRQAENGAFVLEPRPLEEAAARDLPEEERALYDALVRHAPDGRLTLRPHDPNVRALFAAAKACLRRRFPAAWKANAWVAVLGWFALTPLALMASVLDSDLIAAAAAAGLSPTSTQNALCAVFCGTLAAPLLFPHQGTFRPALAGIAALTLACCGLWALRAAGLLPTLAWALPALTTATALFFTAIIKAPSKAVRAVLDELEGLALYIRNVEMPRMEQCSVRWTAPEDTPAVFRRLLPYALALGVKNTWCNRFAAQLDAGAQEERDDLTQRG